jgi:hypothetical protein
MDMTPLKHDLNDLRPASDYSPKSSDLDNNLVLHHNSPSSKTLTQSTSSIVEPFLKTLELCSNQILLAVRKHNKSYALRCVLGTVFRDLSHQGLRCSPAIGVWRCHPQRRKTLMLETELSLSSRGRMTLGVGAIS